MERRHVSPKPDLLLHARRFSVRGGRLASWDIHQHGALLYVYIYIRKHMHVHIDTDIDIDRDIDTDIENRYYLDTGYYI